MRLAFETIEQAVGGVGVITLTAQLLGIGLRGRTAISVLYQFITLAVWFGLLYGMMILLVLFNYCEANCSNIYSVPWPFILFFVVINLAAPYLIIIVWPRIFRKTAHNKPLQPTPNPRG